MKCIKCYREIDNKLKFCIHCGTMQPVDRAAYELEHPELADAIPEEERARLEAEAAARAAEAQAMAANSGFDYIPDDDDDLDVILPTTTQDEAPLEEPPALPVTNEAPAAAAGNGPVFVSCPDCGRNLSPYAPYCPHCGCPMHTQGPPPLPGM